MIYKGEFLFNPFKRKYLCNSWEPKEVIPVRLRDYFDFVKKNAVAAVHRGAICQVLFWWIYYCHSSESIGVNTGNI